MRALTLILSLVLAGPAMACGPESDCVVLGDRTYRLYVPSDVEGPIGAFFHAHGYRGSGSGAMNNAALRGMADRLGLAFVALDSAGDDWELAHTPSRPSREVALEYDYVTAVIADVADRIDLDQSRLISTGFSAGGMMTWTLACGLSDAFAGFVPYAGTFWAPEEETCTTPPTTIVHIHGNEDRTVPFEGRPIGPTRQGNILRVFDMYAEYGDFGAPTPFTAPEGMRCLSGDNPSGRSLTFCEFDGGHSYSVARVEWAIDRILNAN